MKYGIIGAMDVEVNTLKSHMNSNSVTTIAGMEFCEGTLGNSDAVIVKSGVGKVNAACCVQILEEHFKVDAIINTGVAGSLDNDINIGDVVVSTDAIYHDVDATVFGYQPGEVPQMGVVSFPADESLRKRAAEAIRNADSDINVFEGRVCSGDQFISKRSVKDGIKEKFGGSCCEMEGCAIAQASYINKIPFVIVRAISDKADESVQVSYEEFEGKAAVHCAKFVEYMLEH